MLKLEDCIIYIYIYIYCKILNILTHTYTERDKKVLKKVIVVYIAVNIFEYSEY